jgi:hypothetical protein
MMRPCLPECCSRFIFVFVLPLLLFGIDSTFRFLDIDFGRIRSLVQEKVSGQHLDSILPVAFRLVADHALAYGFLTPMVLELYGLPQNPPELPMNPSAAKRWPVSRKVLP